MSRTILGWMAGLVFVVVAFQPGTAEAAFRMGMAGTMSLMTPKVDPLGTGISNSAKMGFGGGILFEVATGRQLSLDIGVLYVSRKFTTSDALGETSTSYTGIQLPVLIRIWTNPYLSFGLGGHYTKRIGDVTGPSTGIGMTDYGVLGSVAVEIPVAKGFQFFIDGRYIFGIADGDPSSAGKTTQNEIQALFGIRFGESWIKN